MKDQGVFAHQSHEKELEQIRRGDFRQLHILSIDTTNAGFPSNGGARGLFELEGNAIVLLPRYMTKDLVELQTVNTARIYIKINHEDNQWLPFSLIANSLDFASITGTIFRFWIRVTTAAAGSMYLMLTKGVTVQGSAASGGGPGGGGYAPPAGNLTP